MDSELHLSRFVSKMRGGQCGTTITDLKVGAKGFITSPNYPSDYPPDEKCTWWLKAKVSKTKKEKNSGKNVNMIG